MRRIEKERKKERWIIAIHEHKKKMHEGSNHLEKKGLDGPKNNALTSRVWKG